MTECPDLKQPVVLVADDSQSLRRYVANLLTEAGYLVLEAEDGEDCLRVLSATVPDVVLLDVEMPVLSGHEVLGRVGLTERLYSIILFTTQSTLAQICAGFDLGADDYVVKPFQEVDLLARIRAAIRNTRHKRALVEARQETDAALARLKGTQHKLVEHEKVGAVATLAAGAAHHINNPLGFMMSNLSTLQRYTSHLLAHLDDLTRELAGVRAGEWLAELELKHRLPQIRRDLPCLIQETREGGQRIAVIVQQLAQLELGLAHQGMTELNLVELVQPLVGMLAVLAPEGTEVVWSQPERPVLVHGSLTLLNTALVALLKNACEALGSEPGTISVSIEELAERAEIVIRDSGTGVTSQHLPALFDPFFSTKSPESHVGLGLTIAQRFISGHGGRISISSNASGTSVHIEIPRSARDERSAATAPLTN